ncbi:MAG: hypothetical protein RBR52_10075 [Thiomonas sp.]|uniref:hypothetical protein n=1 Tax=Thiomonas sp. TaxID=2047785 RepID=UPI002A365426|nr:hypothetical protein [Thiomonas sp.]MDY0330829.1 hypothetical protein [Thiomonas sp.]
MSADLPLDWIFEKTPKGRDELATRANGLLPGQRNLLILADGHRPVHELLKAGADPQRCMQALCGLIDAGYLVHTAEDAAQAAHGATPSAAANPSAASPHALLIALAEEQFGAQAPRLVQKIEQHPDTPEGQAAAVQACVKFIRLFIDEKQAAAFAQRAQELLQH